MRGSLTRIVLFVAALAAVPATADAQQPPPSGGATAPPSQPASPFAPSGGGNALLGRKVRFRGAVQPRLAGRAVAVQYLDPATAAWTRQARTTAERRRHLHRPLARAPRRPVPAARGPRRRGASASASARAAAHRLPRREATWFGPGFFGNRPPAAGLTRGARGVAHRTLPCGTIVAVLYRAATWSSPRSSTAARSARGALGPHRRGRAQLGFTHTDRIGAAVASPPASALEVADDPVRQRRQRRRGLLDRQRPVGQHRVDALAHLLWRGARSAAPTCAARRRARVERPDRLEASRSPSAVSLAVAAAPSASRQAA